MDLSIVIVNWNSRDYLQKCIASIVDSELGLRYEIIVIDSASYDGCDGMLQRDFPQVRFIQSDRNGGFAQANNQAYALSSGECILFLNPDTEVRGSAISAMYDKLRSLPAAGAVGCRLLNTDGTVQTSCIQAIPTILNQLLDCELLRARWPRSRLWGMAPVYENAAEPSEVEAVSGACLMLKRGVFERVGGFSEDYFMYAEDLDLSLKTRQAGYRNYYVPSASVVHHGGSSVQRAAGDFSVVMMREAIWRFLLKTRGRTYGVVYRFAMLASAVGRLLLLGLSAPLQMVRGGSSSAISASARKWRAIFRWCLKRERWVRQYYPPDNAPPSCLRRRSGDGSAVSFASSQRSDS